MIFSSFLILQFYTRVCLKNHFRNLQAPLCGIFSPHSVDVARYVALIRTKSPTNWDSQLTKSLFQPHSSAFTSRSPISEVDTFLHPSDMMSTVRYPSFKTFCTACFYCLCLFIEIQRVAEHHGCGQNRCNRVCNVFSCDIRCRAVAWLIQAEFCLVQAGGRKHSDGTCHHTCLIGKDISEHVLCQNYVKLARIVYKLHCTVINQHMLQRNFRIIFCNFLYNGSPQTGGIQNICFIYTCYFLSFSFMAMSKARIAIRRISGSL